MKRYLIIFTLAAITLSGAAVSRGQSSTAPAGAASARASQHLIGEVTALDPSGGQMDMIRGMVEGLARRLKANPDDPDGWVRLVRAYAVLGEAGQRDATLNTARARYASRPQVLVQLDAAAKAEPMK